MNGTTLRSSHASLFGGHMVSARRGPLKVTHRAGVDAVRIQFVIPKAVGTAVVRNRARRRLRAAVRELSAAGEVTMAAGVYRITVLDPMEQLTPVELRYTVGELLREVRA